MKVFGFKNRCPACGEADALRVDLADVGAIDCKECGEEITREQIREQIGGWTGLLAWLDTAPEIPAEE